MSFSNTIKSLFLPPILRGLVSFLLSSAVVFQNDEGVLEKQGPDEQSDIGIGLRRKGRKKD